MEYKKTQHILLKVPYYSQHLDVKDTFWQSRSCGIVALAMAMVYKNKKLKCKNQKIKQKFIEKLISEGVAMGARDSEHGWIHDGIVALAKKHGFKKSFRKEFPEVSVGSRTSDKINALRYIVALLMRDIPVLASFKNKKGRGGHLVLLTGFCNLGAKPPSGFYYHDPNEYSRKSGAYKFTSVKNFLKIWKARIVVVKK